MIDLGNIAGLHAHNHELHTHCPHCGRWATLPLAEWVSQGKGSLRLPISVLAAIAASPDNCRFAHRRRRAVQADGWNRTKLVVSARRFGIRLAVAFPETVTSRLPAASGRMLRSPEV